MISSYKQLTGKYLKSNKKRTLLTIIGIILSVALSSSIGLFFKGIQIAQIEDMKNQYGAYHLLFQNTDDSLISKIANNPKVSRSGLLAQGKVIKVGDNLTLNEKIGSDKALELIPFKLKEGKLPESENGAAIEKWVLRYIDKDAKVGDKIKINEKEYTLSGILEDNVGNQKNNEGVLLLKSNNINKEASVLLVEISPKANLRTALEELKQLGEDYKVTENSYLLFAYGIGNENSGLSGLYMTIGVIIGIVLISTIAVIYNSFQISVVERIKQFGLLRAVGSTPRQIRKIVLREATLLAAFGVPIGLLFGVIAIYSIDIVFKIIGRDTLILMRPTISPAILIIGALVGTASIYISAMIPVLFAGRISPLVAISSRTSITKEKIKRRKNLIIGKVFGFEGALAAKNIKRNKKRYRITVFSIIISVVLFVTFKSFMDMSFTIYSDLDESQNIHFSITREENSAEENKVIDNSIEENLKSLESVKKLYRSYDPYFFQAVVDKSSEVKEVKSIGKEFEQIYRNVTIDGKEKTLMNASIEIYDTNSIEVSKKYLKSGNIDIEKLNKENGIILIYKNRIYNDTTRKTYNGPVADINVGDEISLQYDDQSENKVEFGQGKITKVKVMAILKNQPFIFKGGEDGLKFITTEELGRKLSGNESLRPINLNIVINDIKLEDTAKTEIEQVLKSDTELKLINNIDNNRNAKSIILMVQILMYGFVIVVSLIGSVNIINTLTTNIILRKREFATLKSIGLTQKGLKKMIILEGLFYGVAGTAYGSILGCGLSFIMSKGMVAVREFGWRIPWDAVAIAGICALFIGYISVLSPLSRIKKENLIEVIRDEY